jgi:lipopolysaccharide transport system ATP-binding protein
MSKSDIAVSVRGLSKSYTIAHQGEKHVTLAEQLLAKARRPFARASKETFWALKDVEFDIKKGDVVGIIGRNGAGKSTLLKILSRITEPTTGQIDLYGRVGSLLEVGTGFHPELTGRENIFLNGAILGMSKFEIKKQFDAIVAFAGVEAFLDTPVKRYSSGMYVRLAFAVAAHLESEILIVDEVLAVGDAEFQKKCLGKMKDVASIGRTVLFVSHQMSAVQALCSRVLALRDGIVVEDGDPRDAIANYSRHGNQTAEWVASERSPPSGDRYFAPKRFQILNSRGEVCTGHIGANENIRISIEGAIEEIDSALTIGIQLDGPGGENLFWAYHTDLAEAHWPQLKLGYNRIQCDIPAHWLNEGEYTVQLIASLYFRHWICQPGRSSPIARFTVRGDLSESPLFVQARPGLLAPLLRFSACGG